MIGITVVNSREADVVRFKNTDALNEAYKFGLSI